MSGSAYEAVLGRSLYARFLMVLCLVCAVLPLLPFVGESPRGLEVRPLQTGSTRMPVSDVGSRTAGTPIDVDDVHEDVVPPRAASLATRTAHRPSLESLARAFSTRAGTPLDRPPRLAAAG